MQEGIARFRAALELREITIAMQRQRLVREHPDESSEEIDRRLTEWVTRRQNPAGSTTGET